MSAIDVSSTEGKWEYLDCRVQVGRIDRRVPCQLCGTPMRYEHMLTYPSELGTVRGTTYNRIFVGVECAVKLLSPDQEEIPRLAENETKRKEQWRIRYQNPGVCRTTIDDLIDKGKL